MEWEELGEQKLLRTGKGGLFGGDSTYSIPMWRTPVPGGWFIITMLPSNDSYDTNTTFYPDPEHAWDWKVDPEAEYLLRPAGAQEMIEG